jgi:SAM-dependent methyltransferase
VFDVTSPPALTRFLRKARGLLHHWSASSDRAFHDQLFSAQTFDAFDPSYPGLLTIRRFADHAAVHLPERGLVLDLGCGVGEITTELARRRPDLRFLGVDHSSVAVDRARALAARLAVANVGFEAADVESFEPPEAPAIVLLFDSFHHLRDPKALVGRLGRRCERFLLIEPQGDWKGSWKRALDMDWIVTEMDKIRARVSAEIGEPPPLSPPPAPVAGSHGEAVEHRYSLDEFHGFFSEYAVQVRGTVAGIETYPSNPYASSRTRALFGSLEYDLLRWIDEDLRARDLDLLAKHWVLYAQRGGTAERRRLPTPTRGTAGLEAISGPYDMEFLSYDGPQRVPRGSEFRATVRFRNRSYRAWPSDGARPVCVSYHWLDGDGLMHTLDGKRTPLPRSLEPGEECSVMMMVQTPAASGRGRAFLAIDLVEEGIAWFSDAGIPWLRIPFRWQVGRPR